VTPVHLETDRLVIRPWRLDEAARLLDILSRVEVVRWLGDGEPDLLADLDAARAEIESWHAIEAPRGAWAVEVKETGVPAGSVMLVGIPGSDGLVQIGWNLHPDSHGQGYAAEAARAVLDHGLAAGLGEIRALMHLDNEPSIRVAQRLGMRDLRTTELWYDSPSRLFIVP
jgi:RimJ/RimL family protein N-acetyltransferase